MYEHLQHPSLRCTRPHLFVKAVQGQILPEDEVYLRAEAMEDGGKLHRDIAGTDDDELLGDLSSMGVRDE